LLATTVKAIPAPTTPLLSRSAAIWNQVGPLSATLATHKPVNASTMGDVHAVLTGAFQFGVQRGWLTAAESPMPLVQRPSRR
jgi:hypothetical protein